MDGTTAVEFLASALEADAAAQEAGHTEEIGERYDEVLLEVRPVWDENADALSMGFHFWDCWADARNHDWNYYPGITENDWPGLAREVADAVRQGRQPEDLPTALRRSGPGWLSRLKGRVRQARPSS